MSQILTFNLSYTASVINSVVCLFDGKTAFQYGKRNDGTFEILNGNQLLRDNSVALAGFNASEITQVDINGNPTYIPTTATINLPSNSYTSNLPSRVYGTNQINDTYSVLEVNSTLAQIEPGFSRLKVSYQHYNVNTGTYAVQDDYFDCPFYEGWNVTARELNNIVSYVQNGYAFLQKEIDILNHQVYYGLSHEQWRGLIVSGKVSTTRATSGLYSGALNSSEFSHDIEAKTTFELFPTYSELKAAAFTNGSSNIAINQTSPASEYGRDTSQNGVADGRSYGFYISEAVDNAGNRCIVMVIASAWNQSSNGSFTIRHDFTATGGAVDKTIGNQSGYVYSHISAYCATTNSDGTIAQNPNVMSQYPLSSDNTINSSPYQRMYQQFPVNTDAGALAEFIGSAQPVWSKGYYSLASVGNHDGPSSNDNGAFSPPTSGPINNTANFHVQSGWTGMTGGTWDTISIGNQNHPRLVFYPDDNTTQINVPQIYFNYLTNNDYNLGQGGYNRAVNLSLTSSTQDGNSLNSGNSILPYTLNLTTVFPPNGPQIDSANTLNSGCIGQTITIAGNYFNAKYDSAYIGGQPASLTIVNQTTATVIIPSTAVGITTLQLTDGVHSPSSIAFTVNGQPIISSVAPVQASIGQSVIIYGNNFGIQDGASSVKIGNQLATINSWTNTQVSITVPNGVVVGPNQVILFTDCGESTTSNFNVSSGYKVIINPHSVSVSETNSFQFSAQFFPNTSSGTVITGNVNSTWSVNGQVGGENTHGTISQAGLYQAPASMPPNVITVTVQYYDSNSGKFYSDSALVTLDASPLLTISPTNAFLAGGAQQQYTVSLLANGNTTDVTAFSTFLVNDTPGGDTTDGIINSSGLYTAPINLDADTNENITAQYVYNGNTLYASAVVTASQSASQYATLTVESQINIYLGDGRFAYVPQGSQIIAYPNQYVYVQLHEKLDNVFHLPMSTYLPVQQVSMSVKNAFDNDIANVLYNLADGVLQNDGTTQTLRTIVLGIVDPTSGRFQSAWDIANPNPVPQSGSGLSLHNPLVYGSETKAFSAPHSFKGSIIDYINDLSGGAQSQLDTINNRSNIMIIGKCSYDIKSEKFHIIDKLNILGVSGKNTYGILGSIEPQTFNLKQYEYIYIDANMKIQIGNFSEIFTGARDANTIILGAVVGDFQTTWSTLKSISIDVSHVDAKNEKNYMRMGSVLIQWGYSNELTLEKSSMKQEEILLSTPFEKSYIVLTQSYQSNGGTPTFENTIVDNEKFTVSVKNSSKSNITSKISWVAIGI